MSSELSEPMRESESVELKKTLAELKQGLISMVAILNKHGAGELWFGVAPNGNVVGLYANEKTLRDVSQAIGALSLEKLDTAKIRRFVERAGLTWDNAENALDKLGLRENGKLLNAAKLFFSTEPPLQLRCAVFATTSSSAIIDRHDFDGDILELIEEANQVTGDTKEGRVEETSQKPQRNPKEKLLALIKEQSDLSFKAMADLCEMSINSVQHHLNTLKAALKIHHVGPTKLGHWEILDIDNTGLPETRRAGV